MNRSSFRESPEQVRRETIDLHLGGRVGRPGEISELVAFVANEKGSFMNGQPIRIDGGMGSKIAESKKD